MPPPEIKQRLLFQPVFEHERREFQIELKQHLAAEVAGILIPAEVARFLMQKLDNTDANLQKWLLPLGLSLLKRPATVPNSGACTGARRHIGMQIYFNANQAANWPALLPTSAKDNAALTFPMHVPRLLGANKVEVKEIGPVSNASILSSSVLNNGVGRPRTRKSGRLENIFSELLQ